QVLRPESFVPARDRLPAGGRRGRAAGEATTPGSDGLTAQGPEGRDGSNSAPRSAGSPVLDPLAAGGRGPWCRGVPRLSRSAGAVLRPGGLPRARRREGTAAATRHTVALLLGAGLHGRLLSPVRGSPAALPRRQPGAARDQRLPPVPSAGPASFLHGGVARGRLLRHPSGVLHRALLAVGPQRSAGDHLRSVHRG